ncbi:MAG: hypothetical protein BGO39_03225 [Chloroflexi bacterium 54-19]|nr:MAG: hypothetical protein BGO39_03225 [Chloroflexi bacterium 54-19]
MSTAPAGATSTVAPPFTNYYDTHQGIRLLGNPLTNLVTVNGYPAQYFEKGRIENHQTDLTSPDWKFMYGRLTAELIERNAQGSVNNTSMTYADLKVAMQPQNRQNPPQNYTGGVVAQGEGVFVPFDSYLRAAPGYLVPRYFWNYINRQDLFPGGWLHDVGLPMTQAYPVRTTKNGVERTIVTQAFERSVLTYDLLNPLEWQIERGNIGSDMVKILNLSEISTGSIEIPAANALVTVPVHILARVGEPGEQVTARLTWQDGTRLNFPITVLRGEDGKGLVIGNMGWGAHPQPPTPPTQPASLEIYNHNNVLLAQQPVVVLNQNEPSAQSINLYWVVQRDAVTVTPLATTILRTEAVATAALNELLWGPLTTTNFGYYTALPTPQEVLAYPGRQSDWGPRVTLNSLEIVNGVATADFSKEMKAYGGGSTRVYLITRQITLTLQQFPGIKQVQISIEGDLNALQP